MPPSLLDEIFPIPQPSPHGQSDSLAQALRRSGAVAVIVMFLVAATFFLTSETPNQRRLAKELTAFWTGRQEFVIGGVTVTPER